MPPRILQDKYSKLTRKAKTKWYFRSGRHTRDIEVIKKWVLEKKLFVSPIMFLETPGAGVGIQVPHFWASGYSVIDTPLSEVAQSCPTLCDPLDCSLPGSFLHGFSRQECWSGLSFSFSRGSSWPRDQTQVSRIPGRQFNLWATREAITEYNLSFYIKPHIEFELLIAYFVKLMFEGNTFQWIPVCFQ